MRRNAAIAGFVIFLLVDVALAVVLYRNLGDNKVPSDDTSPTPITRATPSLGATDPTATTESAGRPTLVLADGGVLAKLRQGRCVRDSHPLIQLSRDAGKTFQETALPLLSKADVSGPGEKVDIVRTILQIRVDSPEEITVVGSDAKCVARRFDTEDGGQSWTRSDTIKTWYVDASGTGVVSPEGASNPGCTIVALSALSDRNAKVACADGTIRGTDDNGDEWVILGRLDGVTGLSIPTLADGFGVAPDNGCKSRAFVTADAGGQWEGLGCISRKKGATALVGTAGALFALVGDAVYLSDDAGKSWKRQTAD